MTSEELLEAARHKPCACGRQLPGDHRQRIVEGPTERDDLRGTVTSCKMQCEVCNAIHGFGCIEWREPVPPYWTE